MVSFQCDACTDVVKKPKLDTHSYRCGASFTCVDCSKTFQNQKEWKGHTSCISEAEKYQKGLYKGKKTDAAGHRGNGQIKGRLTVAVSESSVAVTRESTAVAITGGDKGASINTCAAQEQMAAQPDVNKPRSDSSKKRRRDEFEGSETQCKAKNEKIDKIKAVEEGKGKGKGKKGKLAPEDETVTGAKTASDGPDGTIAMSENAVEPTKKKKGKKEKEKNDADAMVEDRSQEITNTLNEAPSTVREDKKKKKSSKATDNANDTIEETVTKSDRKKRRKRDTETEITGMQTDLAVGEEKEKKKKKKKKKEEKAMKAREANGKVEVEAS